MTDNVIVFPKFAKSAVKPEEQWRCNCGGLVFLLFKGGDIRCGTCSFTLARRHFDPRDMP